jgi:hypothetical protein
MFPYRLNIVVQKVVEAVFFKWNVVLGWGHVIEHITEIQTLAGMEMDLKNSRENKTMGLGSCFQHRKCGLCCRICCATIAEV